MIKETYFAGILCILTLFYVHAKKRKDPYALFHLTLNKRPGENPAVAPSTEWLNVGYWKDTDSFPDACRGLALKLNHAANRVEGDRVLDVGHGTGESLIFLLSDLSIPRPSSIVGITSLPLHHERSKERVAALRSQTPVTLYLGDAVRRPSSIGHPLAIQSEDTFDCILALDCAYHFNTRQEFLYQSLAKLSPSGRIALADMCFEPRFQWIAKLTQMLIPEENIISMDEYVSTMKDIGFVDVEVEDITSDVFPKFLRYLEGKGLQWRIFSSIYRWYLFAMGVKFVIASGSRTWEAQRCV